jgi:hypothetical protein
VVSLPRSSLVIGHKRRPKRQITDWYENFKLTADHPRSGRPRVTTPVQDWYIRTSHLRDRYRMETHYPSNSVQTVSNWLREAGLRACRPVVGRSSPDMTDNNVAYGHNPPSLWNGKKCSSLMSQGFVSPGVMVGFAFIVEGISVTPVLWSGIDLEVEGPSWCVAVCHSIIRLSLLSFQAISTLCFTGKTSSPSCGTLPAGSS